MQAIKAVQQNYAPTDDALALLEQFRLMLNDCIRIGLAANVTSLKALALNAYKQLGAYNVPSYYKLCAISAATGILRNHRRAQRKGENPKAPYARRLRLTTCYGFKIRDRQLLLPLRPRESIVIPLNQHTLSAISGHEVRSVTLTPDKLSLSFRKEVEELRPLGFIGVDGNLDNVTTAASDGGLHRYDLAEATRCKATYRALKARFKRNDRRIRHQLYKKYGRKERRKVSQVLHHVSKRIVLQAKEKRCGVTMEKLTGIRKLYRRGNGQGRSYRARLNSWSFAELQRQIEYKARWEGLPVFYVEPHGTSAKCSICGQKMKPEEDRKLKCRSCGFTVDRDVNAARNILARAVRFAAAGWTSEAMAQETWLLRAANPESRWPPAKSPNEDLTEP